MRSNQVDHYTYRVMWSAAERAYAAMCAEFPGLRTLAPKQEAALRKTRAAVAAAVAEMQAKGDRAPEPLSSRHYSGKFLVRVPPDVHRRLSVEAAEFGVSLNRLASAKLSH
jgi:predicted HicB family RNase H-like nuclease